MNKNLFIAALALVGVAAAGLVVAQTTGTTGTGTQSAQTTTAPPPSTAPATSPATAGTGDAAHEARFTAADRDKSNALEGAELDAWKADLAKIDTDKDGKVSKSEFVAAAKSNVIK